jgi:hypothetical protein
VANLLSPSRTSVIEPWLAGAGLACTTAFVIVAMLVRSSDAVDALELEGESAAPTSASSGSSAPSSRPAATSSGPRSARASVADLDAARLVGVPALSRLAERYPKDPAILKALFLAHAGDRAGHGDAVRVAGRLFELSPEAAGDEEIQRALATIANGPADSAAAAFELLATRMGSHGPDVLFDLLGRASASQYAKDRAGALLQDPDVKGRASPTLLVAYDLRASKPCARRALFARAREHGDERALASLKPLTSTAGCGGLTSIFRGGDCYSACLGAKGVAELKEAIAAIEARVRAK